MGFFHKRKDVIMYGLMGILTTLINIFIFVVITKFFGWNYVAGTTIAWLVSVIFAYFTNKHFVFESVDYSIIAILRELLLFFIFRIISYIIDILLMVLFVEVLIVNDLISKIIANFFVILINFFASKYLIFIKKKQ